MAALQSNRTKLTTRFRSPPPAAALAPSASSVRFSYDIRPIISFTGGKKPSAGPPATRRKTCMCSPTTHPGSFRCSLHRKLHSAAGGQHPSSSRLNARRSAMTNSLVRIGTVEGELVRRALAALVRPCAHHQRRRAAFQPRPSRLSVMSRAEDL